MSSPKHLWSGDWQQESEAASRQRAGRRIAPSEPEPAEPIQPAPSGPSPYRRALAAIRAVRVPLPRARVALAGAVALLALAGAAYGLSSLGASAGTASGTTPWLGVRLEDWPGGGAIVASVSRGSPADAAGLKAGDVITQIEGRPVAGAINVTEAVAALSVGDRLELQIVRGQVTSTKQVTLGARPPDTR